jgi:hypothetical protein
VQLSGELDRLRQRGQLGAAYVSIRQHTSAYVSIQQSQLGGGLFCVLVGLFCILVSHLAQLPPRTQRRPQHLHLHIEYTSEQADTYGRVNRTHIYIYECPLAQLPDLSICTCI